MRGIVKFDKNFVEIIYLYRREKMLYYCNDILFQVSFVGPMRRS